jgi:outer membrane lipoprotein SlyB
MMPAESIFWNIGSRLAALLLLLCLLPAGCANMNHAQSGALMGTAIGSVAGAALGSDSGHAGTGALIGGITGAMAGGVLGDSADAREERDLALAQRDGAVVQAQYLAQQQQAMNNFDLVRLAQSGVSDDVIVNMIATRGGVFDLNTDAIIALKSNGVSDRVIVAAQQAPKTGIVPVTPAPPQPGVMVVQSAPPPAVIVEPAPVVWWGRPYPRHYHRPPPHHHGGVDVFFGF